MTKLQAFEILGMDQQDLLSNNRIQELLIKHSDSKKKVNTFIQDDKKGGKIVKVQNFQALIDNSYNHYSELRQ